MGWSIKRVSKNKRMKDLIRQSEGHFLSLENGKEYFSIWAYKKKHNILKNDTDQNYFEAQSIPHVSEYKVPVASKKFEVINIYEKKDLDHYYLRKHDIRANDLDLGEEFCLISVSEDNKYVTYAGLERMITVTLESLNKCLFIGVYEKSYWIDNPLLQGRRPKEKMWKDADEIVHYDSCHWAERKYFKEKEIFNDVDIQLPSDFTVIGSKEITNYPVVMKDYTVELTKPVWLSSHDVDKVNNLWSIIKTTKY